MLIKQASYRTLRAILGFLIKPGIAGRVPPLPLNTVYALERRSLFDLIVLDLVTEQLDIPSPHLPIEQLSEQRRFFFLFRATGWDGRITMYRFSNRLQRIQQRLVESDPVPVSLVPVSVFWGRTNEKEGSIARRVISDNWRASSRFRRFLALFFARSDVLVHVHPALDWESQSNQAKTLPQNLRHIALLLRRRFKHARQSTLGPVLLSRREVIKRLVRKPGLNRTESTFRRKHAKRLVSNLSYPAMRILKVVLGIFWREAYESIKLTGAEQLDRLVDTHTLIYVPNHRSHIDYLVLSYLLFLNGIAIPHIAAGDNLNLPVLGSLLRRCGAFFMRRSFRDDPEYRSLLMNYLQYLINEGHSIEFFIEGTRSRSGWTLRPQYGMLHMLLEMEANPQTRPIALIPTYISYERLIESESYRDELLGASKRSETLRDVITGLRFARQKFGQIEVVFGEPLTLDAHLKHHGSDIASTQILAEQVVHAIGNTAVLTRTNLVACTLFSLGHQKSYPIEHVLKRVEFLRGLLRVESLQHAFTVNSDPSLDTVNAVSDLGFFQIEQERVNLNDQTLASLAWFQNNALHAFATPSLVAIVLLNQPSAISRFELVRQVAGLLPHVAAVLHFHMDLRSVKRWLTHFKNAQLLDEDTTGNIEIAHSEKDADGNLAGLARMLMPMLECMYALTSQIINTQPRDSSGDALIDEAIACIQTTFERRRAIADTEQYPMLEYDRRFYRAFLDKLIQSDLVTLDDSGELTATPRLMVLQKRSTIAIDPMLRETLEEYG